MAEDWIPDGLDVGVRDYEKEVIDLQISLMKWALEKAQGNVALAATLLCLKRTTLWERLKKYGLIEVREVNISEVVRNYRALRKQTKITQG